MSNLSVLQSLKFFKNLNAPGVPASIVSSIISTAALSNNLTQELVDADSRGYTLIIGGTGGQTTSDTISLPGLASYDASATFSLADARSGNSHSYSDVEFLVGDLAHEVGHAVDQDIVGNQAGTDALIVDRMYSEAKADYSSFVDGNEIYAASNGSIDTYLTMPNIGIPDPTASGSPVPIPNGSTAAHQLYEYMNDPTVGLGDKFAELAATHSFEITSNSQQNYIAYYGSGDPAVQSLTSGAVQLNEVVAKTDSSGNSTLTLYTTSGQTIVLQGNVEHYYGIYDSAPTSNGASINPGQTGLAIGQDSSTFLSYTSPSFDVGLVTTNDSASPSQIIFQSNNVTLLSFDYSRTNGVPVVTQDGAGNDTVSTGPFLVTLVSQIDGTTSFGISNGTTSVTLSTVQLQALNGAISQGGDIGSYIGGQIGRLVLGNSAFLNFATTTFFSTAGQLVGQEIAAQNIAGTDLSASVIASGFAGSATEGLGGFAGGLAGATLFKSLGLSTAIGQLVGGTVGAAIAGYAYAELAPEIGLTTNISTSIIDNLSAGLPSLGVSAFEEITGFSPTVNIFGKDPGDAEIGSSIGGLVGTVFLPGIPVLGTVIGQFVGSLVGGIFGPPASVGPNASNALGLQTNAQGVRLFAVVNSNSDNSASASMVSSLNGLGNTAVALLNAELRVIGGSVASAPTDIFIRIFKNEIYTDFGGTTSFPDPTAIDFGQNYSAALSSAVIRQLAVTQIVGDAPQAAGQAPSLIQAAHSSLSSYDPNYASDADSRVGIGETIQQLNYDIQAVSDYSSYQADKIGFLIGYAMRDPGNAEVDWEAEFTRGELLQRVQTYSAGESSVSLNYSSSSNTGHEGLLILDSSYTLANATISRAGNDLAVTLAAGKTVTVTGAFASNQNTLGELEFTSMGGAAVSTWNGADLQTLLLAGAGAPIAISTITLVTGNGLTKTTSADGTHTIVNGSNDTINLNGQNGGIALNGSTNTLVLNGMGNAISASGDGDTLSLSGNNNATVANGQNDTIQLNGTGLTLTAGANALISLTNGTKAIVSAGLETIQLADSDTLTIGGSSTKLTMTGGGSAVTLNGDLENATITSTAGGDTLTANGQNGVFVVAGGGNTMTINGTSDSLGVTGSGNSLFINGASGNTVSLGNYNNVLSTAGTTVTFVDNSGGTVTGGGNVVYVRNSDNVKLSGDGFSTTIIGNYSTIDYAGGYGLLTITGSSNTVTIEGNTNVASENGANNTLTVAGLGERVTVSGTGQFLRVNGGTVSIGANSQITFDMGATGLYSNGNIINVGASSTVVVNGTGNSNDWVQATSADTIALNGMGDGVGASGTGNIFSFTSTGEYAQASGSTLNVASGSSVSLTGTSNTVNLAASATLAVSGNMNTIVSTGTLDQVTVGGTGDSVQMSGGTLTLAGTGQSLATGNVFTTDGFAFSSITNGEYATVASASSMQALANTGANSIEFVVTQYVSNDTDVNISTSYNQATTSTSGAINLTTESDANLEKAIAQAQALGLKILLKPHVDIGTGAEWRAYLAPGANTTQFFANYKAFIVHYAQIAQAAGVGMFSLGSELQSLTGSQYYSQWANIISAVRAVYSGKLTYGSAWSETHTVSFWNLVDVIGVHPYENPTQVINPTLAQLNSGWNSVSTDATHAADFNNESPVAYYQGLAAQYGKQILFTEIGYRSVNGATSLDGNYAGYSYEDFKQQSTALESFFETFSKYSSTWLQGAYLWNWNPDPTQVVTQDFSVQGKPALGVINSWYGAVQAATTLGSSSLTGNSNTVSVATRHLLVLTGSTNTVTAGTGVNIAVSGNSNTVTAAASGTSADTLVAVGNSNTLTGGAGNDTLSASGASNTLVGGGGLDTYQFNSGFGTSTIVNGIAGGTGATGTLVLGGRLDPSKLWFAQSGSDLDIDVVGSTTDQIVLKGWFTNAYSQIATLQFADGSSIATVAIASLVTAMAAYQAANSSFNPQTALVMPTNTALQTMLNTAWSRVYASTSGNVITVGEGNATIDITVRGNTISGGAGNTTLNYSGAGHAIAMNLGTGTDSIADTFTNIHSVVGTKYGETITGTTASDMLDGDGGGDVLTGGGGSDTYRYKPGYGLVTVQNGISTQNAAAGTVLLGAGLDPSKLWFAQSGSDLDIDVVGSTTDQIVLKGWFTNAYSQIATLQFADGSSIATVAIASLVTAMAAYQAANSSFNPQTALVMPTNTALQTVLNTAWSRTVIATGSQTIKIGEGNAIVGANSHNNVINGGLGQTTITYSAIGHNVGAHLDTGTDSMGNTFTNVSAVIGTSYNDSLYSGVGNEMLSGNGGSDTYYVGLNSGAVTVVNGVSAAPPPAGELFLGTQITAANVWIDRVNGTGAVLATGGYLRLEIMGTATSVTATNWFTQGDGFSQLSEIKLQDSGLLLDSGLGSLMSAMTAYETSYAANHGGTAFNPAAAGVTAITDPTVLAAVNSYWHR